VAFAEQRTSSVAVTWLQKISLGEMRASGVRGVIVNCADFKCSHSISIIADQWPDDMRLSDLEDKLTCTACGKRGADVRPDFRLAPEREAGPSLTSTAGLGRPGRPCQPGAPESPTRSSRPGRRAPPVLPTIGGKYPVGLGKTHRQGRQPRQWASGAMVVADW
jgi:hypothetical protein